MGRRFCQGMTVNDWTWDETLYAGSAPHYSVGRMPYPAAMATAIGNELGLDATGRLLDVGCGPGPLTRLLAPLFRAAVGIDADPGMIAEAARHPVPNVEWRHLRAEELPADLGTFDVVTFAQSFHWMDQPAVAERVRPMIRPGGAWVHVGATTHRGTIDDDPLWSRINALVAEYLGPIRRAGTGTLPNGTRSDEDDVMLAAGYTGPVRIEVGGGQIVERTADQIVAAVFSLSSSTPHLFGDRLAAFEADLRRLLNETGDRFPQRVRPAGISIWRP
jgi:2-polyprenyl-3-methyl-5-hydroxy-6-metoxy-1,4-benzoquinol methylase